MSIWQRFLYLIGLRPQSGPRYYELTDNLLSAISSLASHEGRPEDELVTSLLAAGLTHYHALDELWPRWESLSPREQQVAALTCLGYTNRQIAGRLVLSPETVKTHIRHMLQKFGLASKAELRQALADWDFSAWR
jgi:DNA-binding CsgD family transcriptional regulator